MIDAPTSPDPIEIAMEAEAGNRAPDSPAQRLLIDQGRLVRWEIADRRAAFGLKLLMGAAGVVAAGLIAAMVWSASRADGLIVDAFSVPPELAARGSTGEVVARTVLDRLGELDRGANSLRAVRVTDAWTQDVKVQLPQTGVSLGDVQRALRQWLGHETHLSGEVVQTALPVALRPGTPVASQPTPSGGGMGVRITARTGIGRTVTAEGPADALPDLSRKVAERLFADARPIQDAEYLFHQSRYAEATAVLQPVLPTLEAPIARASAENLMGQLEGAAGRWERALAWYLRAAAVPDRVLSSEALYNAAGAQDALGRSAESYRLVHQAYARLGGARGRIAQWYRVGLEAGVAAADYDPTRAANIVGPWVGRPNVGSAGTYRNTYARLLAQRHEKTAAYRIRQDVEPTAEFFSEDWPAFLALGRLAAAHGDRSPRTLAVQAFALSQLGQPAEALRILQDAPEDCYFCVGARGLARSRLGDAAGAERDFALTERLDPHNIYGIVLRGRERLRRGDANGALETFRRAEKAAPHYADAIAWGGEAQLALGDVKAAEAAFRRAEPYAPRWGRLRLKWGEALARLGKADEARGQWKLAATMDLTGEERGELAALE